MELTGFVGWRGMVGSVLVQRMLEENDFEQIEPVFFSTSSAGGKAPAIARSLHGRDRVARRKRGETAADRADGARWCAARTRATLSGGRRRRPLPVLLVQQGQKAGEATHEDG